MPAFHAATRVNAELLGWQNDVGTVQPGKLADIIAGPGDPLSDLAVFPMGSRRLARLSSVS